MGRRWFKNFNGVQIDSVYEDSTPSITERVKRRVDTSFRTILKYILTASAVNYLTITNSATTGAVKVSVDGSDTNIDLELAGKGTGTVTLDSAIDLTGDITLSGDVALNGGDLTSTATTFNVLNSTVTTGNLFGAGTTINVGATTGTLTLKNAVLAVWGAITAKAAQALALVAAAGYNITLKMGDNAAANKVSFIDVDNAEVASIDSNGVVTAIGFSGPLTGNVTGNVSGTAATVTIAAQTNITSLGTLTTLTVDDITVNGNAVLSAGASSLTITPTAGQKLVLDGHWGFDGVNLTSETDANTVFAAYTGKNITIESVTFDGGVIGGVSSLGVTGTRVTEGFFLDLTVTNTIAGSVTGSAASLAAHGLTAAAYNTGMFYPVTLPTVKTTSVEENVAGLSSAITLANEARLDFINHAANAIRHTTGQQSTAAIAAAATDKTTVIALANSLTTLYAAHNTDAVLASGWAYHDAQAAAKALAAETTVTTLAGAITRLNDIKAKYNDHEDETTGHASEASVTADQVAAADAANGAAIRVTVAAATATCGVQWSILNDGTGDVTGVSAVAGAGYVDFTFSADPQGDTIISYTVIEVAA
jgi:hypothetical protein